MAGLPGGFRMQPMKYLGAATDPCLTRDHTVLPARLPKAKNKVSPRKCSGYNSTAEPVEQQD